jgi:FtsH-binding integral membrane protein
MSANTAIVGRPLTHDESATLFSQTMALVAVTTAAFAVGAYAARNVSTGCIWFFFIAAFVTLFAVSAASKRSEQAAIGLLLVFGLLIGAAVAPTISYYASSDPRALWESGGATALFIIGFGAAGYGTRRDLSKLGRTLIWALLGLILFGVIAILARLPNGLRRGRARQLRRADQLRLPATAPREGHQDGPATRRVNLPRHLERLSAVLSFNGRGKA